jgi:peptide/nickel transport system substrate-binding protein
MSHATEPTSRSEESEAREFKFQGGFVFNKLWIAIACFSLATTLTACPPLTPTTGSLTVIILGNPTGTTPSVTVNGPKNFSSVINATTTIPNLEAGSYVVNAATLLSGETEFDGLVTGSPVTISANQTSSVTVAFSSAREPFVFPAGWTVSNPSEVKLGGTFRAANPTDYSTFNPFAVVDSNSLPSLLSAGGLFRIDPTTRDYVPYMAKSYTVSSDNLTWTFTLRKGMKWSDGKPITADDWVSTAQIHEDAAVGSNSYDSFVFGGGKIIVSKVDALTVKIVLPLFFVDALVTLGFDVYPDHVFGAAYRSGGASAVKNLWAKTVNPTEVVSSGAFRLKTYTAGQSTQLERNPFFGEWNRDSARKPLPYLDAYSVIVGDGFTKFQSGETDTVSPVGTQLQILETGIANGSIKAVLKKNYSQAASSNWITFNFNRSSDPEKQRLFRSDAFRQAISHLTNRAKVISDVFTGNAAPAYTSVYGVFQDWISSTAAKFDFNLQAAKDLLATLGYATLNTDGYLTDSTGKVLEFDLATNSGNTARESMVNIFVADAKLAGVKVNPKFIPFNDLVSQMLSTGTDRVFDGILLGLSGGSQDYPLGINVLKCTGNLHAFNKSGACLFLWETQLETLFNQGSVILDRAARIVIAKQAQDLEAQHQPFVYIASPKVSIVWLSKIKGEYPTNALSSVTGTRNLELTWIQP